MYFAAMKIRGVGQISQLFWSTEMSGETRGSGEGEVGCMAQLWGSVEGE